MGSSTRLVRDCRDWLKLTSRGAKGSKWSQWSKPSTRTRRLTDLPETRGSIAYGMQNDSSPGRESSANLSEPLCSGSTASLLMVGCWDNKSDKHSDQPMIRISVRLKGRLTPEWRRSVKIPSKGSRNSLLSIVCNSRVFRFTHELSKRPRSFPRPGSSTRVES